MNITDAHGRWRLFHRQVEDLATGEVRCLENTPSAHSVAMMHERTFVRKCQQAFDTGIWPN